MSKTSTVVVEETQDIPIPASVNKKQASTVSEIFESLSYGPAPEFSMPAEGWLEDHGRAFGHFIDGKWVKPEGRKVYETKNPATGLFLSINICLVLCNLKQHKFIETVGYCSKFAPCNKPKMLNS